MSVRLGVTSKPTSSPDEKSVNLVAHKGRGGRRDGQGRDYGDGGSQIQKTRRAFIRSFPRVRL